MAHKPGFSHSLNAARFAVSLLVVLAHVAAPPLVAAGAPKWTVWFLNSRSLSSSFFFLLSGFILTASLFHQPRPPRPFRFLIQRVSRLWPVHAAAFVAMLPTAFTGNQKFSLPQVLTHSTAWLTMCHGFFPEIALLYNTPAWAVTSFALGYLVVAIVLSAREWPTAWVVSFMAGFWILLVVAQTAGMAPYALEWNYQILQSDPMPPGASWMQTFLHTTPLLRLAEIAIGSFAALLACRSGGSRASSRLPWDWLACATAAIVAGLMVWLGASEDTLLFLGSHGLFLPLCLFSLYALWRSRGWLDKVCSHPFLLQGGRSAILIYFIHLPVFRAVQWFWSGISGEARRETETNLMVLFAGFVVLLSLAFLLERPYARLCDSFHRFLCPSTARRLDGKQGIVPCMP